MRKNSKNQRMDFIKAGHPKPEMSHRQRVCTVSVAVILLAAAISAAGLTDRMTVLASTDRPGIFRSRGTVQCEEAVIDAADLHSLYSYVTEKKNAAARILQQLGTRFRVQAGTVICDRNPDTAQEDVDLSQLGWPVIAQAAADSQKVPDGLAVLNPEAALHIEGVEEYTDYYVTATADNISRGKAAWADGGLLLGNGADNDRAHGEGLRDGEEGRVPEFLYPLFSVQEASVEIRHVHTGAPEKEEGMSGCYQNTAKTKTETRKCDRELEKTEATWYPNPEEPDGGSWHGGYYTCPSHQGAYDSPGKCPKKKTVTTTVWSHEIVCGLEDALYARLIIRGTDTDYTDRAVRLEAVLEQGDAYGQLVWPDENQLVWTDNDGNVLGTGPELTVQSPGAYRCSISAANEEIDNREVSTTVRISGFLMRN